MEQFLALVAVENVSYHFDILYGYTYDENLEESVKPGVRVQIPFGRNAKKPRQGIVFECGFKPQENIRYKSIASVLDPTPVYTEEMLSLSRFLKDRTFCTYHEGAKIQLPTGFNYKTLVTYAAVPDMDVSLLSEKEKEVYDYLLSFCSYMDSSKLEKELKAEKTDSLLESLSVKGFVVKNFEAKSRVGDATVKTVSLNLDENDPEFSDIKLTEKQKSVVSFLKETGSAAVKEVCYYTGVTSAVIAALCDKGVLNIYDKNYFRIPKTFTEYDKSAEITLTAAQQKAYEGILSDYRKSGAVSLLYGITGSGKTSVFIKLIDKVISEDRDVIVMVPEIALTPQMVAIFKSRYGSKVAVFHSGLSMGERKDEYRRVREKEVKIAVGTRSAVFAPFENLGLIVMDEEQEHTYKSESSPRFHARDVAKFRANHHKALLLLASATPSIETYSFAKKGVYSLHKLEERFGDAVLPDVTVTDLINDRKQGNKYSVSIELQDLIIKNLNNKKQTILLMNRRGYNTYAACEKCGEIKSCPACNISLTFHRDNNRLMCHYCGYSEPFTVKCFYCGKERVRYEGYGTQRVEEELTRLFPDAKILRLDADSSISRERFEESLNAFSRGEYDIMLGTQMVAKGLNFENVTLVGVINADGQLKSDDFRSAEQTFDLLTQVVGRSGRGSEKGVALIQTTAPENNIIKLARDQDYESFYNDEIKIRKALIYPPYCDLCTVLLSGENEHHTFMAAKCFYDKIIELLEKEYKGMKLIVFSPVSPRISKVNNKFRYRILIKCKNTKEFRALMSSLLITFPKSKTFSDISVSVDMNSLNMI